jgi:hypothetical protein
MLKFINPDHDVQGEWSLPWVNVLDQVESDSLYQWLNATLLNDSNYYNGVLEPTRLDGYIIRSAYISQVGSGTPSLNFVYVNTKKEVTQFTGKYILTGAPGDVDRKPITVDTSQELAGIALPSDAEVGQFVFVANDRTNESGAPQVLRESLNRYRLVSKGSPLQWEYYDTVAVRASIDFVSQGRIGINYIPRDYDDPTNFSGALELHNLGVMAVVNTQAQPFTPIPKPNDMLAIQGSFSPVNPTIGDLVTVVSTNTVPSTVQCIGIYEGLTTDSKHKIRVLVSAYEYGGVKQYATYADFPATGESNFLYYDQATGFGYAYDPTFLGDVKYRQLTPDLSPYATLVDLDDVRDELFANIETVQTNLDTHVGLVTVQGLDAHTFPEQKDGWTAGVTASAAHIGNAGLHWDSPTKEAVNAHLADAAVLQNSAHHMTQADRDLLASKAGLDQLADVVTDIDSALSDMEAQIIAMGGLGRYLTTFDSYATNGPDGSLDPLMGHNKAWWLANYPGVAVNDFVNVRHDETEAVPTPETPFPAVRYILESLDVPDGMPPVWKKDLILDRDISTLMNAFSGGQWTIGNIPVTTSQFSLRSDGGYGIDPATLGLKSELLAHENAQTPSNKPIHIGDDTYTQIADTAYKTNTHATDGSGNLIPADRHPSAQQVADWTKAASDIGTHAYDSGGSIIAADRHITAAERTAWNNKANQTDLAAEVTARTNADTTINARIDKIRDSGEYLGNYPTKAGLPTVIGTNWKVNDWAIVKQDEAQGYNMSIYRITSISGTTPTWTFDVYFPGSSTTSFVVRRTIAVTASSGDASKTNLAQQAQDAGAEFYVDLVFEAEQATMRFVIFRAAGGTNGTKNLAKYVKSAVQQKVMFNYTGRFWQYSGSPSAEDSNLTGGGSSDAFRFMRNFGTSGNSPLNTWVITDDSFGQPMGNEEIGNVVLAFPAHGSVYSFIIYDLCTYPSAGNQLVDLYMEITKMDVPSLMASASNNTIYIQ